MELERLDSTATDDVPLHEIEPSPVESPQDATDDYFPSAPSGSPPPPLLSRPQAFGLGSHGPVYYLTRVQKYSSYVFTIFTTAHVANTAILPLTTSSVRSADTYLLLTRPYYQSFPLEAILVATPLLAHIVSGIALRVYRRRQAAARYYGAESHKERRSIPWPKVSGTSALGFVLTPLAGAHVIVNRILPLWHEGGNANIGLEYISHGFARHPVLSYLVYIPLIGVMSFHTVWGWARWLSLNPEHVVQGGPEGQRRRRLRRWSVNGVSAAVAALWMAGGLGIVARGGAAEGWLGKEYDMLFSQIPLIGHWL